tara:strand:- start:375 stop:500 length:126 start_codon:yes stop_codon:yes gene_type:complete
MEVIVAVFIVIVIFGIVILAVAYADSPNDFSWKSDTPDPYY